MLWITAAIASASNKTVKSSQIILAFLHMHESYTEERNLVLKGRNMENTVG